MKTVLVTGGSRGIGKEIATIFSENGYRVIINFNKSKDSAISLRNSLLSKGFSADIYKADISKDEEILKMFEYINDKYKGVDILINNAGISKTGLITETSVCDWNEIFSVNIDGMYKVTNQALKYMIDKKEGSIVNISSMWGVVGASCEVAYSATKSAVIGYTKALSKEVGLSNIRVNCVSPGVILTEMNSKLSKNDLEDLKNQTSLNRLGTGRDIAEAVYFLASEKASFITGQNLIVDGGFIL